MTSEEIRQFLIVYMAWQEINAILDASDPLIDKEVDLWLLRYKVR